MQNNYPQAGGQAIIPDKGMQDMMILSDMIGKGAGGLVDSLQESEDYDAFEAYRASGNDPKKFPGKAMMRRLSKNPNDPFAGPLAEKYNSFNQNIDDLNTLIRKSHKNSPLRNANVSELAMAGDPIQALQALEKSEGDALKRKAMEQYSAMNESRNDEEMSQRLSALSQTMGVINSMDPSFDMKTLAKEAGRMQMAQARKQAQPTPQDLGIQPQVEDEQLAALSQREKDLSAPSVMNYLRRGLQAPADGARYLANSIGKAGRGAYDYFVNSLPEKGPYMDEEELPGMPRRSRVKDAVNPIAEALLQFPRGSLDEPSFLDFVKNAPMRALKETDEMSIKIEDAKQAYQSGHLSPQNFKNELVKLAREGSTEALSLLMQLEQGYAGTNG